MADIKNKRYVYIVEPDHQYIRMFKARGWELTDDILAADLIQFTGGHDVTPSLYGEAKHETTDCNPMRDRREIIIFEGVKYIVPMAGICRGAQFLNVMCGGAMWQNVDGHARGQMHDMIDWFTGETIKVTSTHHQMMRPGPEAITIATAHESSFRTKMPSLKDHKTGDKAGTTWSYNRGSETDTEVCYYAEENCLCFQPHPEYIGSPEMTDAYFEYIEDFCFNRDKWKGVNICAVSSA